MEIQEEFVKAVCVAHKEHIMMIYNQVFAGSDSLGVSLKETPK